MFLLHFLPDSFLHTVINIVLFAGLGLTTIGFFLVGWIPGLRNYKTLVQILGVVLLAAGIYWKGGYGVEMEWRSRVAELEAKLKLAEEKSQQVNTVIKEKVITKIQKVKEVQVKNQQIIKEVEKIIDAECRVPKEAIDVLNAAARNEEAVIIKDGAQ
jgi:hypothetical protein